MNKRIFIAFVLVLYLVNLPLALATQDNRRDGNWWRTQSYNAKLSYVVGFFDGMDLGFKFSYWKFTESPYKSDFLKKIQESYTEYQNKYFSNITNDQIVDGLNDFYNDFKNRTIQVNNAVWIVVNEIAGTSENTLNKMIQN